MSGGPAPRDGVVMIPTGLSPGSWGDTRCSPSTPWWCPTPPVGPTQFPAELRGPSPSLREGRTTRATQQPFRLVPRLGAAARASLGTAAGLCYTLRPAAPPGNSPPLRRPAHCGPRLPTPSLPTCWHLACPLGPTSPRLCPHQCCCPQGPGLSLVRAGQRGALIWAGAGAAEVGIIMTYYS